MWIPSEQIIEEEWHNKENVFVKDLWEWCVVGTKQEFMHVGFDK